MTKKENVIPAKAGIYTLVAASHHGPWFSLGFMTGETRKGMNF
jgi:hypothetical protein